MKQQYAKGYSPELRQKLDEQDPGYFPPILGLLLLYWFVKLGFPGLIPEGW